MAATVKDVRAARVPDEVAQEEEQNAGVAASESDGKMPAAAHARVEEHSSGGGGAARHGEEEEVSEDGNVQTQGGFLLGWKRKAIAMGSNPETTGTEIHDSNGHERMSEDNYVLVGGVRQGRKNGASVTPGKLQRTTPTDIQNKKGQGEYLRAENEMLRLQLVHKTKELEVERIRRLELELDLKNKENKSLKEQNEKLTAENGHYRKTAKSQRNPRLCRFCNEYVVGHDYRNCPERLASASSEQEEADDSS